MKQEKSNKLTKQQIQDILQNSYDNPDNIKVSHVKPLEGGVLNEIYLVDFTKQGIPKKVIVKAYQGISLDPTATASTQEIYNVQKYCSEQNGKVPGVINILLNTHHRDIIVMDFVEGELLKNATEAQLENLGKALAQFHNILQKTPTFAKQPSDLSALATELSQSFRRWWRGSQVMGELKYLFTLSKYAIGTITYPSDSNLPSGLLHGDVHAGNVLKTPDNQLVLLDLDLCKHDRLIKDLANAACMFCIQTKAEGKASFDFGLYGALLKGYSSERALTQDEVDYLPTALKDRAYLEKIGNMKLDLEHRPAGSPFNELYEKALFKALDSKQIAHIHNQYRVDSVATAKDTTDVEPIADQAGVLHQFKGTRAALAPTTKTTAKSSRRQPTTGPSIRL